jgi:hypothetical protein
MNWPLAAVVVAVLLFGYCAYSASQATETIDKATDEAALYSRCYTAGYDAGFYDRADRSAPQPDESCRNWFESGLSDGRRDAAYEAPFDEP